MSKTLIDLDHAGPLNVTSGLAFQPGGKVIRNRTTRPSMLRRLTFGAGCMSGRCRTYCSGASDASTPLPNGGT